MALAASGCSRGPTDEIVALCGDLPAAEQQMSEIYSKINWRAPGYFDSIRTDGAAAMDVLRPLYERARPLASSKRSGDYWEIAAHVRDAWPAFTGMDTLDPSQGITDFLDAKHELSAAIRECERREV